MHIHDNSCSIGQKTQREFQSINQSINQFIK